MPENMQGPAAATTEPEEMKRAADITLITHPATPVKANHAEIKGDSITLTPGRIEAQAFLDDLEPDGQFTFQSFDDRDDDTKPKRRWLIEVLHGTLAVLWDRLVDLNRRGAGIFVTINRTDLTGRKKENIVAVRAVFVDLDGSPLQPILECALKPNMVIESSPGRYHAYWLCRDFPLNEFERTQGALVKRFSGDSNCMDISRVMRMPGFFHRKGEPVMTRRLS